MTVYVRWYGKVLEGELLDGEVMGMKQVRIPLDGHHPIALFTPDHVYETTGDMLAAENLSKDQQELIETSNNEIKEALLNTKPEDYLPADDRQSIEAFKQANWDHERNHLRIDKLDEFYWLWRMYMVPFGYVEAEAVHESCTPKEPAAITQPYQEITQGYSEITSPYQKITQPYSQEPKKPSKQMLRTTGRQEFADSTQLSIFD